jgi:hypothetical protein
MRKVALLAGAGFVVLVGIIIAIVSLASGSSTHATTASTGAKVEQPPPTVTTSPTPVTVDVAVDATPARAKISVDGKSVGKGSFHGPMTKDGATHQVVVSADGFSPETRTVTFDRDVRLDVSLHPLQTGHYTYTPPVTTAAATTTAGATAGSDLQVQKPKRNIDEKDPY